MRATVSTPGTSCAPPTQSVAEHGQWILKRYVSENEGTSVPTHRTVKPAAGNGTTYSELFQKGGKGDWPP